MIRMRIFGAVAAFLILSGVVTAADFPTGTYTASKQPDWSIKFAEKGKYAVIRGGKVAVEGTYQATATDLTLTDEKGPAVSKNADEKTGKYKWKLDGGKLKFTKVEDKSTGRELILTSNEWAAKKE
jgi:hypothetical protein